MLSTTSAVRHDKEASETKSMSHVMPKGSTTAAAPNKGRPCPRGVPL